MKAGRTVAPIRMRPHSNSWGPWKPPYLKTGLCGSNSLGLSGWVHPHLNRWALTQMAKVLKLRRRLSPRDYGKMKSGVMELQAKACLLLPKKYKETSPPPTHKLTLEGKPALRAA